MARPTRTPGRLLGAALAASVSLTACGGPVGPLAGGRLSGSSVAAPVADWTFADQHALMAIEVRPERPYSVQIHSYVVEGRLYFEGAPSPWSRWRRLLRDDPRIRVRFGDRVYAGCAIAVTEPAEIAAVLPVYYANDAERPSAACAASWSPEACGFTGAFFRFAPAAPAPSTPGAPRCTVAR